MTYDASEATNAAIDKLSDRDDIELGAYMWCRATGEFYSPIQGRGKIVSWIDAVGDSYEPYELDADIEPVFAVIELLEGEHAGIFTVADVSEEGTETVTMN